MIETSRLHLRPYTPDDFEAFAALFCDSALSKLLRGKPMSREDAWHRLLRYAGHWTLFGFGIFAVFERESGRHVGETGLADFHRGLGARFDSYPEAAWLFNAASHGKGYASEAALAAHEDFARRHGGGRTVCIIDEDNAPSLRVATKLAYRRFGSNTYRDSAVAMLERDAP